MAAGAAAIAPIAMRTERRCIIHIPLMAIAKMQGSLEVKEMETSKVAIVRRWPNTNL